MQQNPDLRGAEVVKTGERAGKYLTPELYNVDPSQGVFYRPQSDAKAVRASQMVTPPTSKNHAQLQRELKLQRAAAEPSK